MSEIPWYEFPLIAVLTFVTLGLLRYFFRRAKPTQSEDVRSLSISKGFGAFLLFIAAAMIVGGSALWIYEGAWIGVVVAVFGLIASPGVAFSMLRNAAVTWSDSAIEGPVQKFGVPMWRGRVRIDWADILRTGKGFDGNWFVAAKDGRRVRWSQFHRGYGALIAALKAKRPDLALPADMR